jgi:hypothetical protein
MFVYYTAIKCFASARPGWRLCPANRACICKIAFFSLVIQITIFAMMLFVSALLGDSGTMRYPLPQPNLVLLKLKFSENIFQKR